MVLSPSTNGDYEYDIFLSYTRKPPVGTWVKNHFLPLLEEWLGAFSPEEPRIYVDWQQQTGVHWPANLRRALKYSRCLVAVWSPFYFRSSWCVAEWQSMREREKLLGLGTHDKPKGLVYPVVFSDGLHFPEEAKRTQYVDLSLWNIPYEHYRNTDRYIEFTEKMQFVAQDLAKFVVLAPPWQNDWPVVEPPVYPESAQMLTRL